MDNPFKAINWNFNPEQARKAAAALGTSLGVLLIVLAVLTAMYACYSLGLLFNVGWLLCGLVAVVSVLALAFHAVSVAGAPNNAGRLVNAIFFGLWAMALLVITAAYFWLMATGSINHDGAIDFVKLEKMGGSADIVDAGQSVYAFSAALPLLTVLLGVIVPRVSASPLNDLLHKSMGHAWSGWALNIASIAAALYGAFHILTFGQIVGMSGFGPVFAAVVLDVAFLGAKTRLTSLFKIRRIEHPWADAEFMALVALCSLIGGYALLCNLGVTRLEPLSPDARLALMASDKVIRLTVDLYGVLSPVVLLALLAYAVAVLMAQAKHGDPETHPTPKAGANGSGPRKFAKDEPTGTADPFDAKRGTKGQTPNTTTQRTCLQCGATFQGSTVARYCSTACKSRAKRARAGAKGGATP